MYERLFCQLPICNLFTQHVIYLYGETPLVNCGPRSYFFTLLNQPPSNTFSSTVVLYFTANISFHSIRLILCFQQTSEIDNLTERWGKVFWLCCAGSKLLLTPVVRPAISQLATPSEATPFSYWSIKPWFLTEGKLITVLIIPSS